MENKWKKNYLPLNNPVCLQGKKTLKHVNSENMDTVFAKKNVAGKKTQNVCFGLFL